MTEWLTGVVESIGYVGITLLMAAEMWVAVISSEMVMTFSGYAARNGELSLIGAIVAGVVGTQLGAMTLYGACRWVPEHRVRGFLTRHGDWLGLDDALLRRMEDGFQRHEVKAVVVGRLMPGLRGVVAIPAGLLGMRAWPFFGATLVGGALWTAALAVLGYLLGSQHEVVDRYGTALAGVVVAALAGLLVWRVVKVRRVRRARG